MIDSALLPLAGSRTGLRPLAARDAARTAVDNLASQKALTRAGFEVLTTGLGLAPSGREVELVHYERQLREGQEP